MPRSLTRSRLSPARLAVLLPALACSLPATAQLTGVSVANTSAADETLANWSHATASTLGSVSVSGTAYSVTHRMASALTYNGTGGAGQLYGRFVGYDLAFSVDDPTNDGYALDFESVIRSYSDVVTTTATGTSERGDAAGLGFTFTVSTDGGATFSNIVPLWGSTAGVVTQSLNDPMRAYDEDTRTAALGPFVGDMDFVLRASRNPVTNRIFYQNDVSGTGSINGGLLAGEAGDAVAPSQLGNFVTITATYNTVPEPASAGLLLVGAAAALRRRRA